MSTLAPAITIVAAIAAVAYLPLVRGEPSPLRTVLKTLPLVFVALGAGLAGAPWLLVAALVLSALGDLCLAQAGESAFVAGLGAFLLAHIAYAVLFFSVGNGLAAAEPIVLAGIGLFALFFGLLLVRRAGALAMPVGLYVLAIAGMGFGAAAVGGAVLLGAVLFMASDALIGTEKFLLPAGHPFHAVTAPAVWVLYIAGQALIVAGLLALL